MDARVGKVKGERFGNLNCGRRVDFYFVFGSELKELFPSDIQRDRGKGN